MAAIKNFSYSTVAVAPSPATSGTSLTVSAGEGALFALDRPAVIYPTGLPPLATNAEIVTVTGITGDVLTITRAQEGTSARTIVVGDQIAQTYTAGAANEMEAAIANAQPGAVAADVNPAGANIAAALALKQNVGNYLLQNGSAANLTNFPTLNQNTTGRAAFANLATMASDVDPAGTNIAAALANKQAAGSYATSAQGAKADTAVQPNGNLGTPASGNLAFCTFPTLNQNTTGTAGNLSAVLGISMGGSGGNTILNVQQTFNPATQLEITASQNLPVDCAAKFIHLNNANAQVLTIQNDSVYSPPHPVATRIDGVTIGAGQWTFSGGPNCTVKVRGDAMKTAGEGAFFSAYKKAANYWYITGDLTA